MDYFSPLEPSGRRADIFQRPELAKGTVDFVATGEYIWRTPLPMPVLFVVDVSASSVASGLLRVYFFLKFSLLMLTYNMLLDLYQHHFGIVGYYASWLARGFHHI